MSSEDSPSINRDTLAAKEEEEDCVRQMKMDDLHNLERKYKIHLIYGTKMREPERSPVHSLIVM